MTAQEVGQILAAVQYKDWSFIVGSEGGQWLYLQPQFIAVCRDSGAIQPQKGRKWRLSQHMTKSEIVQTAFKAVMTAEEHEARENFTYRGRAIFGPHYDVDDLAWLAAEGRKDVRP